MEEKNHPPHPAAAALAQLRRLYIDANFLNNDNEELLIDNRTIQQWAHPSSLNDWATDRVRNGWMFATARYVVDQAQRLDALLCEHAERTLEDAFDPLFPTAKFISPSILGDDADHIRPGDANDA